jgi:RNA polymerase sigma factor (sigma-70 family)
VISWSNSGPNACPASQKIQQFRVKHSSDVLALGLLKEHYGNQRSTVGRNLTGFHSTRIMRQENIWMQTGPCNENNGSLHSLEFEAVVQQYYQPLYQFAFSLARSQADACDLTQHTFYTWRLKGQQLRDPSKVKAWLFTTLHRAFLQTRRRETRFPHYELDQVDSELPWISPDDAGQLDSANVLGALAKIDDIFRAPLALFYLEDCSYKEIALILNVPLGTVKSRIARGIAQLQKLLAPSEYCGERAAA